MSDEKKEKPGLSVLSGGKDEQGPAPERISRALERHGRSFVQGELIFSQGDAGETAYLVHEGVVEIVVPHPCAPGLTVQLATLRKGDFFGEGAAFGDGRRSATAIAQTACRVLELGIDQFLEYLAKDSNKEKKRAILTMAKRTAQANERYLTAFAQIHDLEKEKGEATWTIDRLKTDLTAVRGALEGARTDLVQARAEIGTWQDRAERERGERERLELELSEARIEIVRLKAALKDDGTLDLFEGLAKAEEQLEHVEGENLVLMADLTEASQRVSSSSESADEALGNLLEEMEWLQKKLAASENRERNLERQLMIYRAIRNALRKRPLVPIERSVLSPELLSALDGAVGRKT